jgi:hypothetical protein
MLALFLEFYAKYVYLVEIYSTRRFATLLIKYVGISVVGESCLSQILQVVL